MDISRGSTRLLVLGSDLLARIRDNRRKYAHDQDLCIFPTYTNLCISSFTVCMVINSSCGHRLLSNRLLTRALGQVTLRRGVKFLAVHVILMKLFIIGLRKR